MKEYILNIKFKNWQNQLWFMNEETPEIKERWQKAIQEVESLRNSSEDEMSFQNNVIEYFKNLGFVRIQK